MSNLGMYHKFFFNLQSPSIRILFCGYTENYSPPLWYHKNRISPYWRFYWGAAEGAILRFEDSTLHLDPENVVFVPPEIPFGTEAEKPFSQLYIHFDWIKGPIFSKPLIFPASEGVNLLGSARIWHNYSRDLAAIYMYRILFCFLAEVLKFQPENQRKIDQRIQYAMSLFDDIKKNWHPEAVAKELSISYYHFMDLFKRQVGVSPGHYRTTRRMQYARCLLAKKELTIKEIADKTGFGNQFHFSKVFRQFFKQSPSACRKEILKNHAHTDPLSFHRSVSGTALREQILPSVLRGAASYGGNHHECARSGDCN